VAIREPLLAHNDPQPLDMEFGADRNVRVAPVQREGRAGREFLDRMQTDEDFVRERNDYQ